MPYLSIHTNQSLSNEAAGALAGQASKLVAAKLGKPERYVMVRIKGGETMLFAGSDAPLAYLELKSIGLPVNTTGELSKALCELLQQTLAIDPARIYIEFANASGNLWGWDSGTF